MSTPKVEQLLNVNNTGKRDEVLNMGTGGYHTVQEVEVLSEKGLKYSPDLVIVLFCLNDFDPSGDGGVYRSLMKVNAGENLNIQAPQVRFLLNYSRFLFWGYSRINSLFGKGASTDTWYEKNVLRGRTTVEVGLSKLSRLQEKENFKALFLILPGFDSRFDSYRYGQIHQKVFNIGEKFPSVPIIDLKTISRRSATTQNSFPMTAST